MLAESPRVRIDTPMVSGSIAPRCGSTTVVLKQYKETVARIRR
ncbi:hypothetical protein AB5I41_16250 [Sphingomonas sp. MMS24-JH45]